MPTARLLPPKTFTRITVTCTTVLMLLAMGTFTSSDARAGEMGCVVDPDWATIKTTQADEVLALTNYHRATLGLSPLVASSSLTAAAEWKAAHMAAFGYMTHDDPAPPVGRSWNERIRDCGYQYGIGENIAFGYRTPATVVAGWLSSPGHRRNIEDPDYVVMGAGAALDSNGTVYWAQTFGTQIEQTDPRDSGEDVVDDITTVPETEHRNERHAERSRGEGRCRSRPRCWFSSLR